MNERIVEKIESIKRKFVFKNMSMIVEGLTGYCGLKSSPLVFCAFNFGIFQLNESWT